MTSKTTYKSVLTKVIDGKPLNTEDIEKLTALRASIEKKSGAERKPTATQLANKELGKDIIDFLTENGGKFTVSDLIKQVPSLAGLSNQKVSAIVRTTEGIYKVEDKRKSYFTTDPAFAPADGEDTAEA